MKCDAKNTKQENFLQKILSYNFRIDIFRYHKSTNNLRQHISLWRLHPVHGLSKYQDNRGSKHQDGGYSKSQSIAGMIFGVKARDILSGKNVGQILSNPDSIFLYVKNEWFTSKLV